MELVVVGGSNAIARGIIKKLAPQCSKIKLLDHRPFRKSVYAMQRSIPASCELEKVQVQSGKAVEYALEGADTVVYFTHDYLSMTHDKNDVLKRTAISCSRVGAGNLIAVCPVELDLHYSEDKQTAVEKRNEAEHEALAAFENTALLRSNVVFGAETHLLHYLTQCAFAGRVPKGLGGASSFSFHPVHSDDLATCITTATERMSEAKGQRWCVSGSEGVTVADMMVACEKAAGKSTAKLVGNMGISDLVEEWFAGIAHDKNLAKMAQWYESTRPNLHENDFMANFGVESTQGFSDYYAGLGRVREEDYLYPLFSSYKQVSLD